MQKAKKAVYSNCFRVHQVCLLSEIGKYPSYWGSCCINTNCFL